MTELSEAPLPRTNDRAYDLRQRLDRAVRWLRDAEDIARVEMSEMPTADRIRSIYEQVSEDVLNGKTSIPPVLERLRVAEENELILMRAIDKHLQTFGYDNHEGLADALVACEAGRS